MKMKCFLLISIFSIFYADYNGCSATETRKVREVKATVEDVSQHRNLGLLPQECGHGGEGMGHHGTSGQEATISEFPWLGLIGYKYKRTLENSTDVVDKVYRCTATLISNKYLLTAGHCVRGRGHDITGVRLGDGQDAAVEKQIEHPEYSGRYPIYDDIALLRLSAPVDFSQKDVRPICLPVTMAQLSRDLSGQSGTLAVWGKKERTFSPDILLRSYATIQSEADCLATVESYSKYIKSPPKGDKKLNVLCAVDPRIETCGGISATPLVLGETNSDIKKYTVYGIFSIGPKKCNSTSSNLYTDVSKYVQWILDNIEP